MIKQRKFSETHENSSTEEKSTSSQLENYNFRILDDEQIDIAIKSKTESVARNLNCSFDFARALLIANNWDEKSITDEMEKDRDYIKNTFKFDPKEAEAKACGLKKEEDEESTLTCGVCYDDCE